MDAEYYRIEDTACKIVNKAIEGNHRICSIGTTTMRAIESSYTAEKLLAKPSEGWTNIFIHPPYNFNIADALITNSAFTENKFADNGMRLCKDMISQWKHIKKLLKINTGSSAMEMQCF